MIVVKQYYIVVDLVYLRNLRNSNDKKREAKVEKPV